MSGFTRMNRMIGVISSVRLTRLTNTTSMTRRTWLPGVLRLGRHARIPRLRRKNSKSITAKHARVNRMVTLDRAITIQRLTCRDRFSRLYILTILSSMSM